MKTLWRLRHPEKMREYKRKYYLKYRDRVLARSKARYHSLDVETRKRMARNHNLKIGYGINVEQYEEMLRAQSGVCFICKKPPKKVPLHVDHCHRTGKIRKLLCMSCNTHIGRLEGNPGLLDSYCKYMETYGVAA